MASITKRPNGKYQARVRVGGKYLTKTFGRRSDARAWAEEQEDRARSAGRAAPACVTVGDLIERYMIEETPRKRSARWEALRFRAMLGQGAKPRDPFCDVLLSELRPEDAADWRDRRLKEVSAGSVLREWNSLSAVFVWAVKELRWLDENPFSFIKRPAQPAPRNRRVTDEEIELMMHVAGYAPDCEPVTVSQRVVAAWLFAIETAMRAGEICGLKHDHIDGRVAHIAMTKNGRPRDVPLSTRAMEIIGQMPEFEDGSVFGLKKASLDAIFRKLRDRAGIEGMTFHDSRAEALTRLSKKMDVMRLARISGHRDINILQNTYYRETAEDLVSLLD